MRKQTTSASQHKVTALSRYMLTTRKSTSIIGQTWIICRCLRDDVYIKM